MISTGDIKGTSAFEVARLDGEWMVQPYKGPNFTIVSFYLSIFFLRPSCREY